MYIRIQVIKKNKGILKNYECPNKYEKCSHTLHWTLS